MPSHRAAATQAAQAGWQGRLRRASGGLIKPQPSAQELADRKDAHDIQRTFSRPMTVVVVQPKGGAGKTPTTIGLASALGAYRGGYVVGWDDNETRGTLAVRVDNTDRQRTTVWDLLRDLPTFERTDARVGDLSHYVRSQGAAQFDALVSDDSPGNMAQIGESEFQRIHAVLQRFYRQIVIDTGNNVRSPNWQAAVNAADQIVVVSTYQRDVGYSGSWVLDHLIETGRAELASSAITVLTAADPRQDPAVRSELISHFRQRTRAVVEIPYDPLVALGGPIEWNRLRAGKSTGLDARRRRGCQRTWPLRTKPSGRPTAPPADPFVPLGAVSARRCSGFLRPRFVVATDSSRGSVATTSLPLSGPKTDAQTLEHVSDMVRCDRDRSHRARPPGVP